MTTLKKVMSYTLISSIFSKEEAEELGCYSLTDDLEKPYTETDDKHIIKAIQELLNSSSIPQQDLNTVYTLILGCNNPIKFTQTLILELSKSNTLNQHFNYVLSHSLIKFFNDLSDKADQSLLITLIDTINTKCPKTFQYFMTDHHKLEKVEAFANLLFGKCHHSVYVQLKETLILYGIERLDTHKQFNTLMKTVTVLYYANQNNYKLSKEVQTQLKKLNSYCTNTNYPTIDLNTPKVYTLLRTLKESKHTQASGLKKSLTAPIKKEDTSSSSSSETQGKIIENMTQPGNKKVEPSLKQELQVRSSAKKLNKAIEEFLSYSELKQKLHMRRVMKGELPLEPAIMALVKNNQEIPSELSEYTIRFPHRFKQLLLSINNYTRIYPDTLNADSFNELAAMFFTRHLTFESIRIVHKIIEILFQLFPDHFTALKHSIYHTALVHAYALNKTTINNEFNNSKPFELSQQSVDKQRQLKKVVVEVSTKCNFKFNLEYSENPEIDCGLDKKIPISLKELGSRTNLETMAEEI